MRTHPTYYYLKSSGQAIYKETHPMLKLVLSLYMGNITTLNIVFSITILIVLLNTNTKPPMLCHEH